VEISNPAYKTFVVKPGGTNPFAKPIHSWGIKWKWKLKEKGMNMCPGFIWLRLGTARGSFEHGNKSCGRTMKLTSLVLPLWSSCQSFWLQIQRSGFDSRRYQIFWEVLGLERGPISLVNTTEELLGRESTGSGLEIREYGRGDPWHWPRGTLYPKELALTSLTSGWSLGLYSSLVGSGQGV
jgi:hypothetical protein